MCVDVCECVCVHVCLFVRVCTCVTMRVFVCHNMNLHQEDETIRKCMREREFFKVNFIKRSKKN